MGPVGRAGRPACPWSCAAGVCAGQDHGHEPTRCDRSPRPPLVLVLKEEVFFPYYQVRANNELRPVIFQGNAQYTADMQWNQDQDWCIMQINFKVKRDITLDKGVKIPFSQASVSSKMSCNF